MLELSCTNTERIFHQWSHKCLGFSAIWSNFALCHLSHLYEARGAFWCMTVQSCTRVQSINCGREAYLSLFVFKIKLHIKSSKLPHQSPLPSVSLSWYLSFYLSFKLYLYFLSLCVQNQIAHWIIQPATPSLSDHKEDHLMRRYMGGLALHHSPLGFIMIWHGK